MTFKKDKIIILFPHTPNPRMLKRIYALKEEYNIGVVYWDRGIANNKQNQIPLSINKNVILKNANEGNPLGRIGTTFGVMFEALKIIKKNKPKYIYISKMDMLMIGVIYKLFFNRSIEIIYEVSDLHSLLIDKQNNIIKKIISLLLNKIEKFLCKPIKLLVVTSEYFYNNFYGNFIDKNRVIFIPNTPNPKVFSNFNRIKNEKFTIGFIGSIRYAEQLEMLIEAAEISGVNVFIAGTGVDYDRIKKYAEGKDYVQLYGEYEYEKEIKLLYEKVDCIYSVYDASLNNVKIALPNRLYEAIYSGTPLVAAKNTYLGDIVEEYNIGKTIKYNDIDELINILNELKTSKKLISDIESQMLPLKDKWVLEEYNKKLLKAISSI